MARTIDPTGLTTDQRHYVAATLYQWWRVNGPTMGAALSRSGYSTTERAGKLIDEGVSKYPEIIRAASTAVRARIDRFRDWRYTPNLILHQYGPRFTIRQYDNWGQFKGVGPVDEERRYCGSRFDWLPYLERRKRWDESDYRVASQYVKDGRVPVGAYDWQPVPEWLKTAVRDYARILKRDTLVPTKSEIQRYRKACGLIKPRAKKTSAA